MPSSPDSRRFRRRSFERRKPNLNLTTSDSPRWQKTVLIVEDDRDLRRIFGHALMFAGFRVQYAADGVDALRIIESHPPHLVVLDLGLPTLDGLSVHDEIMAGQETRTIPVVVVTGSAHDFSQRLPDTCVLRKPVTPRQLVTTVRQCLGDG